MTKKVFSVLLAVVLVVTLCGCGENANTGVQVTAKSTTTITSNDMQTTTSTATTTEKEEITSTTTTVVTTIDEKAVEEEYKSTCETISFKDLARNPDSYIGKTFAFTGKVIQVLEPEQGEEVTLRINVTKDKYGYWDDTIIAAVDIPKGADRILEDDIITIYGDCAGLYTYESVFGQNISLPAILIRYYNLVDSDYEYNEEATAQTVQSTQATVINPPVSTTVAITTTTTAVATTPPVTTEVSTTIASSTHTIGEQNSLKKAKQYIEYMPFSCDGLIGQLEYEGYSNSEATYGANNCGANWNEQAVKKAETYLSTMAFSYNGLIGQLEYDKFTHVQAVYGTDNCGADWNEQATKKAKTYLDVMAFSFNGLVGQLEYDEFTHEQAVYGVEHCGADWNEQAAKKAKTYLDIMTFSKDGLIGQLEYDGFTHEQAVYGVEANGY